MRKIGINAEIAKPFGFAPIDALEKIREVGFDAVFPAWDDDVDLSAIKQEADRLGLEIPFVHAPFRKIEYIWEEHETADWVIDLLTRSIDVCAENGIPMVVFHVYKGFGKEEIPTELGLSRIGQLLDHAHARGVCVAVENTEGDAYLDAVMKRFWEHPALGFCFDSGHELCYNRGRDLLGAYGARLTCTHLDDNLGISGEDIFWHDDLHLLPWDGTVSFEGVANRLKAANYQGILMFELTVKSKPNRHENDAYLEMGCDAYLKEAYARAVRFAELFENE